MPVVRFLLCALLVSAPSLVAQTAPPAKSRGFSVFSRVLGQSFFADYQPNRVFCGLTPVEIGPVQRDVVEGCIWPAGTSNSYVFNSGLQVAGLIGPEVAAWAGDTTGAFFYDAKGTTQHGTEIQGMWLSSLSGDHDKWPDIARVPAGDIYLPALQRRIAASDADAWSMAWDGNVLQLAGRVHPLGIAIETRVLGWNHPRGDEDILYINFTLYNVTATNPAAYSAARPEVRNTLLDLARRYHDDVSAKYGVTLPADGYRIERYFTAIATDGDVGNAGANQASVNLPLSLGYSYDPQFSRPSWFRFDPTDHGAPFFAGSGFFGTKVLSAPAGGNQVRLFTATANEAVSSDPRDVVQLYRYLDGSLGPASGDGIQCNVGDPLVTRICRILPTPVDVRHSMSSDGGTLLPGQSANYSVAYLFAAPYGTCPAGCSVGPGNPRRIGDPALIALGVNPIDSLTGFTGFSDLNGDGVVQGGELRAAPRSLLAKAQMAQAIFDGHFLHPTAPVEPEFYLIPGDGRVSILWRPSMTETAGDPYFALASTATRTTAGGNTEINPLYDPNYRQFDVEGYRIYRGRTSDPADLTLLAQFDYAGTTIRDYTGRVNPNGGCAPELGIRSGCPVNYDSLIAGQPLTAFSEIQLYGRVIQVRDGDRIALPGNAAAVLRADTTGSFESAGCWCDTGVPFSLVDSTARNGLDYFYAVTAFDLNSAQSAAPSMESGRQLKRVRPARPGTNVVSAVTSTIALEGRGKTLDPNLPGPTYDPATGRFSGPFPPANFWSAALLNLVHEVVSGEHEARIRLDSLSLGQAGLQTQFTNGREPIPTLFHLTVTSDGSATHLTIPVQQDVRESSDLSRQSTLVPLLQTDTALAARYGGHSEPILLDFRLALQPAGNSGEWGTYISGINGTSNGARWFDGPSPARNEVVDHPTAANCSNCGGFNGFNNAGTLTGVSVVYQPLSNAMFNREWRNMGASQASARRAADYNLYWGDNGTIDSVIDITHNVPVPFSPEAGGTWGVLNTSAQGPGGHDGRPTVLTPTDWTCVEPFRSRLTQPTNVWFPCTSPTPFVLSHTATLGSIAFGGGDNQSVSNPYSVRNPANLWSEPGFSLYLAGTISQFALTALPARGTVWSLRDYIGFIFDGGGGFNGFYRSWTAVGTELVVRVQAQNYAAQTGNHDLRRVHTVPDPYYFSSGLTDGEGVRFVNLPEHAIVRIYSASGVLLRVLEYTNPTFAGDTFWDLRTRNGQRVASGVYFYHIESGGARRAGRMTIINYNN